MSRKFRRKTSLKTLILTTRWTFLEASQECMKKERYNAFIQLGKAKRMNSAWRWSSFPWKEIIRVIKRLTPLKFRNWKYSAPVFSLFWKSQPTKISLHIERKEAPQFQEFSSKSLDLSWTASWTSLCSAKFLKNSAGFLNLSTAGLRNFTSIQIKTAYALFSPIWYAIFNSAKANFSGKFLQRLDECETGPKLGNNYI